MAVERDIVEVRVSGASTAHVAIAFTPGVPTQPFSVGTNGQWRVAGEGVGPVHLYIGFDGERIHVVDAAPTLPVLVSGSRLGGAWVTTPVPCEIRFGTACLIVRRAPLSASSPNPEGFPSTMSDGGALRHAARQAAHAAGVLVPSSPSASPNAQSLGATMFIGQRSSALAGAPASPAPLETIARAAQAPTDEGGAAAEMRESRGESKTGFWSSASTVRKITLVLMPVACLVSYFLFRSAPPTPPATTVAAGGGSAIRPAPEGSRSARASAVDAAAAGVEARATAVALKPVTAQPSEAAIPQATLAPPAPATASSLARARGGTRTREREALERVANGYFDEAARDYDALAVEHPDDATFKEAARILRAKTGHVH